MKLVKVIFEVMEYQNIWRNSKVLLIIHWYYQNNWRYQKLKMNIASFTNRIAHKK